MFDNILDHYICIYISRPVYVGAFRQSSVVVFISSELVMSAPTRVSVVTIGRYIHHGTGGGREDKSRYSVYVPVRSGTEGKCHKKKMYIYLKLKLCAYLYYKVYAF